MWRGIQLEIWRREGDSNPRYGYPYTRFPGEPTGLAVIASPQIDVFRAQARTEVSYPRLVWLAVWSDIGEPLGETQRETNQFGHFAGNV